MNRLVRVSLLITVMTVALSLVTVAQAFAAYTVIDQPDGAYLGSTTKLDFSAAVDGAPISEVADARLRLSFPSLLKFTTPNSIEPYAKSWGYIPLVESTVDVPYVTGYGPVEFTLSEPVTTFGLEAYNGYSWASDITVTFLSATSETIATVTKYVAFDGSSWDARLFAITSDVPIARVRCQSSNNGSVGYGQFRYATAPQKVWSLSAGGWLKTPTNCSLIPVCNNSWAQVITNLDLLAAGNAEGSFQFTVNNGGPKFVATSFASWTVSSGVAWVSGSGEWSGAKGYSYLLALKDATKCGAGDTARVQVKDPTGAVIFDSAPGTPTTASPQRALCGNVVLAEY